MRKLLDTVKKIAAVKCSALRNTAILLLLIVAGNAILVSWEVAKAVPAIDFFHYWAVALTVRRGDVENVYSPEGMRDMGSCFARLKDDPQTPRKQRIATEFTLRINNGAVDAVATPFLFAVIGFFESGSYERDVLVYMFLCMLCYITAIITLCRMFQVPLHMTVIMLVLLTSWFGPYNSDIRVGNINQLQLALFVLVLWLQKRSFKYHDFISGTILGLAIMFKPNTGLALALIALSWLINRHIKKLVTLCAGMVCGMFIAYMAASFYFGSTACWTQWLGRVPELLQSSRIIEGNIGLSKIIYSLLAIDLSLFIVIILVGIFTFITWQKAKKRIKSIYPEGAQSPEQLFIETTAAVSLGLAFMLLSARLAWFHYYILVIPLAIMQLRFSFKNTKTGTKNRLTVILTCTALLCLTRLPALLLPLTTVTHALVINSGVIILVALGLYEMWREI
jgi:hypothetical protein